MRTCVHLDQGLQDNVHSKNEDEKGVDNKACRKEAQEAGQGATKVALCLRSSKTVEKKPKFHNKDMQSCCRLREERLDIRDINRHFEELKEGSEKPKEKTAT